MNLKKFLVGLVAIIGYSLPSFADKVEDVKVAVKKAPGCESKELSNADALRLVKLLYMQCNAGDSVDAEGCKVPCMKDTGSVVGK